MNVYVDEDKQLHFVNFGGADSVIPFSKGSCKWYTSRNSHAAASTTHQSIASCPIDQQSIGDEGYLVVFGSTGQFASNAVFTPTLTDIEIVETMFTETKADGWCSIYYYKIKITGPSPKIVARTITVTHRTIVMVVAAF